MEGLWSGSKVSSVTVNAKVITSTALWGWAGGSATKDLR